MNKLCQKTIFVLVHSNDMLIPSGCDVVMDVRKMTQSNVIKYNKTLWSVAVESFLEYIRTVFDIYGNERQIGLIVVDIKERVCIQLDDHSSQNWRSWMKTLAEIGPPQNAFPSLSSEKIPGLKPALSMLSSSNKGDVGAGRVIVLGYKMSDNVNFWADEIQKILVINDNSPIIESSEWYFIDIQPLGEHPSSDETPILMGEPSLLNDAAHKIYRQTCIASTKDLHKSLMWLCEKQHNLTCILVQNIPMKEDTSNTQSAMYGVELIMPREAIKHIEEADLLKRVQMNHRPVCGFSFCIGIRWVTPKPLQDIDYYNTTGVYRVTTADVCNRASCCLANFVLEGRSVVLEVDPSIIPPNPKYFPEQPQEMLLLSSHGGILYAHTLPSHPNPYFPINNPISDVPSIGNLIPHSINDLSCKKKVQSKLRVNDFSQLILNCRLAPNNIPTSHYDIDIHTNYWPALTTDTMIFNKPQMPKVMEILMKKKMEFSEKTNCISILQQWVLDHSTNDKNASKKVIMEQKIFKSETEALLLFYKDRSVNHKEIYDNFLNLSSNLPSIVDFDAIIKSNKTDNEVSSNIALSGLCELDELLNNGAKKLKILLGCSVTKETAQTTPNKFLKISSNTQLPSNVSITHKSNISMDLSFQELLVQNNQLINSKSTTNNRKRKKPFEGQFIAIDNVTELYVSLSNNGSSSTQTSATTSSLATTGSITTVVSSAPIITNVPSPSSIPLPPTPAAPIISSGPVDPRKDPSLTN